MSQEVSYRVPDVHCDHCRTAIEGEVSALSGVDTVQVDLETQIVTVRGHGLEDAALRNAIAEAGYDVEP